MSAGGAAHRELEDADGQPATCHSEHAPPVSALPRPLYPALPKLQAALPEPHLRHVMSRTGGCSELRHSHICPMT